MNAIIFVGVLGFIIRIAHKLSSLVWLWWRKEYRIDRMIIHLKTKQGTSLWGGKTHAILWVLIIVWFLPVTRDVVTILLAVFALGVGVSYLRNYRQWFLPPISPKVVAIFTTSMFLGVIFADFRIFPILISLALFDVVLFPLTTFMVIVLTLPTYVFHRWIIHRALVILSHHRLMTVVGITGSYGKTSVKDYLATLVSEQYKTLKTEASKNSSIGISEVVIKHLSASHEIFIAEMGAYKKGEIQRMTDLVKPEIGILTAINPQHQDLFGSLETTMQAKYELVRGLIGRKIVIVNFDDQRTRKMGEWAKRDGCEVWWYTVKKVQSSKFKVQSKILLYAKNINSNLSGIDFDCVLGKESVHVQAPVLGEHQAGNILASIAGAVACGMTLGQACRRASQIQSVHGVMEKKQGIHGSIFIDDTFNNNPDAAKAAISFLGNHRGKRILVFQPMIELGAFSHIAHEEVGQAAAKYSDAILMTNSNYFASFKRGVRMVSSSVPVLVKTPKETAVYIRSNIGKGDMVLFKGKDAHHALSLLLGHSL